MTSEYRASVRINDDAQVKLAAVSGLHYAAAVLSDPKTFNTELEGNPFDNPAIFQEVQLPLSNTSGAQLKQPCFSIQCVSMVDATTFQQKFGVIDEGGKLNINSLIAIDPTGQLLHDALMALATINPGMTEDIADAIVDWVDNDDTPRANGAESSYYSSLASPYQAKNGPLNSLDELLLVRGVTPYLLYGGDTNRNGVQDAGEVDATRGLADFLTVYGREINVSSAGTARIYLNGDDLDTLSQQLTTAVGADLAAYIVASKLFTTAPVGKSTSTTVSTTSVTTATTNSGSMVVAATVNTTTRPTVPATTDQITAAIQAKLAATPTSGTRIRSLMDLIGTQITLPRASDAKPTDPDVVATSPLNDPSKLSQLLPMLLDTATVQQAIEMVPRINVNTAPLEVLMALPNMTDALANQILTTRANQSPTDPGTVSAAWLVTTNTLTSAQYKQMEKYITGKSMVFRVQSIGYFKNTGGGGGPGSPGSNPNNPNGTNGPMARMEAVIDTNQGAPRFLLIRDLSDLENPPGFQPPATQ
jgi:DNA uptake protein ComE-like DNA-binding protein